MLNGLNQVSMVSMKTNSLFVTILWLSGHCLNHDEIFIHNLYESKTNMVALSHAGFRAYRSGFLSARSVAVRKTALSEYYSTFCIVLYHTTVKYEV